MVITHEVLRDYTLEWKKPAFVKVEQLIEQTCLEEEVRSSPRGAQIEALYELKKAR